MNKHKGIAKNTVYTIAGALVLNGVLQLFVYPRAAADMGTGAYGTLLYIMAFVNILGPSIGQALNNNRLVLRREADVSNGDYNTVVILFSLIGVAGTFLLARSSLGAASAGGEGAALGPGGTITAAVLLGLLILLTDFRYYGDVEYRLSLNYRSYFFYYLVCAAGYAAGYGIYALTGSALAIFLTGEAAAFCFLFFTGGVYRKFLARSDAFSKVMRSGTLLVLSYFVTNLTLNIDRLYLKYALGEEAVAVYYVVSLIGKTLVLFVAPVNTIVISYLTKENAAVTKKTFLKFAGLGVAASVFFYAACLIVTPVYIRLFYPQMAGETGGLITVVTASQILAMLSAYLFIIVLTYTGVRWQLALQILHLMVLLLLITLITPGGGLLGFSAAVLGANALRVAEVLVLGVVKAKPGRN